MEKLIVQTLASHTGHGLEAARVVLGHRSAALTELYAEVDQAKAAEIMAKVG